MTDLYMIRHGEARNALQEIIGGMKGDTGLTPKGVIQAERLRDRLASSGEIKADVLIASTLARARQTAEIIAPAIGQNIIFDDEIHEIRPGVADNMAQSEAEQKYGKFDPRKNPYRPPSPGGENLGQFILRVGTALNRICEEHRGKSIVLVCHGGVIDSSFLIFFGLHTLEMSKVEFYTENTSITHWKQHFLENEDTRWQLMKYNDDLHLKGLNTNQKLEWQALAFQPHTGVPDS